MPTDSSKPDDRPVSAAIPGTKTLLTSRLYLRAARSTDAEALHRAFSDAEVMRYWSTLPHADLARTQEWVDGMVAAPTNGVLEFVVCLRGSNAGPQGIVATEIDATPAPGIGGEVDSRNYDPIDGEVIGKAGVWDRAQSELGFLFERAYWRRGHASETLTALLPYLFGEEINLEFITADIDPRNVGSKALLEKFGFQVTGLAERTWCVGEEWVDSVYYKLTREAWLRSKGAVAEAR